MHLSVFMGPFSRGPADDLPLIDQCLDHAVRATEAGFCMVTFGEQHFNNYEPYCNPFLMAARLASELGDTWFGTTIVPLPLRDPLRLAEDSAIVDLLLRGRFIMGLSAGRPAGAFSPDFANFGLDPAERDLLWNTKFERLLDIRGESPSAILQGRLMPIPFRKGGPQIAIGTSTDERIVDTGRRGLPLFLGPCLPEQAASKFALHRRALHDAGHNTELIADATAKSLVTRHVIIAETDDAAWERAEAMAGRNPLLDRSGDPRSLRQMAEEPEPAGDRNATHVQSWIIAGSPESVVKQINAYPQLGIPHLNVRFTVGMNRDLAERSFTLFLKEAMPQLDTRLFPAPAAGQIRDEHRSTP